jgi:hypothetical protein
MAARVFFLRRGVGGDVWGGEVGEASSAVGREDCNEADSCTSRSQDSRSSSSSSSSMHRCSRRVWYIYTLVYLYLLEYQCIQLSVYDKFGGYSALY